MAKKKEEKVTATKKTDSADEQLDQAPESEAKAETTTETEAETAGPETPEPEETESTETKPEETEIAEAEKDETPEAEAIETEPAPAETGPDLEHQLTLAQEEAERNLQNWQRAAAELANFKRRQEERMKMQRDRIKAEVLEGVISTLDDLDLAFQNLPQELDGQLVGWVEGFRLVQRKLDKILDDQNVMPIDTGGKFDPNFHEAVSYEASDEHETDEIIAELRKGYQIGSRVIRPALVRVAQ